MNNLSEKKAGIVNVPFPVINSIKKASFFRRAVVPVFGLFVSGLCWVSVVAAAPLVSVSVAPVHSLVSSVMEGVAQPELLMKGGSSPHLQALLPSAVRTLSKSDLVVWLGPDQEPSIKRVLGSREEDRLITLVQQPDLTLLKARHGGKWNDKQVDLGGDSHDTIDGHLWLSTINARIIVELVADRLQSMDPDNRDRYQENRLLTLGKIDALREVIANQVTDIQQKPYLVFHDAYQYFENEFALNPSGSVAISPDRAPSANRLHELREHIKQLAGSFDEGRSLCIFSEPQFESRAVTVLAEGFPVLISELDPLGTDIPPGGRLWFELMSNLTESLVSCVSRS